MTSGFGGDERFLVAADRLVVLGEFAIGGADGKLGRADQLFVFQFLADAQRLSVEFERFLRLLEVAIDLAGVEVGIAQHL